MSCATRGRRARDAIAISRGVWLVEPNGTVRAWSARVGLGLGAPLGPVGGARAVRCVGTFGYFRILLDAFGCFWMLLDG